MLERERERRRAKERLAARRLMVTAVLTAALIMTATVAWSWAGLVLACLLGLSAMSFGLNLAELTEDEG